MNADDMHGEKAAAEARNDGAPKTIDVGGTTNPQKLPEGTEGAGILSPDPAPAPEATPQPTPKADPQVQPAPQPTPQPAPAPQVQPTPTSITVDGVTLTEDQIRAMQTAATNQQQQQESIAAQRRQLEATRTELESMLQETGAGPQRPAEQPANTPQDSPPAETPNLTAFQEAMSRISSVERRMELQALHEDHGDFDEQAVTTAMDTFHLSATNALAYVAGTQALQSRNAQAAEQTARSTGDAARVEPGAGDGVVPTTQVDISKSSWADLDRIGARTVSESPNRLLVGNR